MQFSIRLVLVFCLIIGATIPARPYTLQYLDASASVQLRWASNTITIALSSSLQNPPSNFKSGSDVVGAAKRALAHWSEAANIQFVIVNSDLQSVSDDNVNLITVADTPENRALFQNTGGGELLGRTRVSNDGAHIIEGDIAINPAQLFSTDGTNGTYDLEAVLTHEIGHFLGLEHSGIVSATMQPHFIQNGLFGLPILTARTLSDDDRAGIRAIYGPLNYFGAIQGNIQVGNLSAYGAHVWAEEVSTGRVRGGNITLSNGNFRIDGLPPGQYRLIVESLDKLIKSFEIPTSGGAYAGLAQNPLPPFQTFEVNGTFNVSVGTATAVNINAPSSSPSITPTFVGRDGQLGMVGVPLVPGRKTKVFVGGTNLTQSFIAPSGISITSPFFSVDQSSVAYALFSGVPVISFDVTVNLLAPPGDYSIRLVSNSGEVTYLSGALTIDLPFGVTSGNLIDDSTFFVAQHYRDFLNREADQAGLNFWTNQITSCNNDATCIDTKRQNVSAAYFLSREFQETGFFVIKVQRVAFGRVSNDPTKRISYQQFLKDAQAVGNGFIDGQTGADQVLEQNKTNYAQAIVTSSDFIAKYPTTMTASQFVDALYQTAGVSPQGSERADAIAAFGSGGTAGRAAALRKVAESNSVKAAEFNQAFVLLQYFGYLRRNPTDPPDNNDLGYQFWLGKLNQFNGDYIASQMVRSFIVSAEYRKRFGTP